jgi:CelD/BcsL family acetyltransferase involved in cellulose biosynthesis
VSSVAEFVASPRARRLSVEDKRGASIVAKIAVHRSLAAVEADWAELEAIAPASVYQTRAFLIPWIETLGRARDIDPFFVVAKDAYDTTIALLCLGIQRRGWFKAGMFLGGKESNFNLGLFRPGIHFTATELRRLLREAASALGSDAPHIFILKNQPHHWGTIQNPLAQLPQVESASFAYATELAVDAQNFLMRKLSKDSRKKLRKKEERLAAQGDLTLMTGDTPEKARRILNAFFLEKIRRCEEQQIPSDFADAATRAFFDRLSQQKTVDGRTWLELSGLALNDRIIATYVGAAHSGRFSAMVNSFDSDPIIAKSSPGDLLLMKLVTAQCANGRTSFDLGIGEARYKMTYCDTTVPLFDALMPMGVVGYILALRQVICSKVKTEIKQRPRTFAVVRRLTYIVHERRIGALSAKPPVILQEP